VGAPNKYIEMISLLNFGKRGSCTCLFYEKGKAKHVPAFIIIIELNNAGQANR
jgi:hypothetical protein